MWTILLPNVGLGCYRFQVGRVDVGVPISIGGGGGIFAL